MHSPTNLPAQAKVIARDVFAGLLDLVYPPQCQICGRLDSDCICEECYQSILRLEPPLCRVCGIPSDEYRCRDCRDNPPGFDYARSAGVFDGALREAIHAMKYRGCRALATPIARLMIEQFTVAGLPKSLDLVIPVPIDSRRMVERGFNQASDIALALCTELGLRFDDSVLTKRKRTAHQVEISFEERRTNMVDAFSVTKPSSVVRKRVLLVDDVFTTGSTLSEAARTLKRAGAAAVICYTSARSL